MNLQYSEPTLLDTARNRRCASCGSPKKEAPAYPQPGRKLVCLSSKAPRTAGASLLPCGGVRWSDRAA